MYNTSKHIKEHRACENENWKIQLSKIKDISEKQFLSSNSNYRYNNLVYDEISKIPFQDINKIKKWCKKNIGSGIDKGNLCFSLYLSRMK